MSEKKTLEELLALERDFDDMPKLAEARLWARIETSIGGDDGGGSNGQEAPSTGKHGTAPFAKWLPRIAYLSAGAILGASGHALMDRPERTPASNTAAAASPAPVPTPTPTPTIAEPATAEPPPPTGTTDAAPTLSPPTRAQRSADASNTSGSRVTEERADLDVARAALAHGRPDSCLDGLRSHVRTYGNGHFAEERESLFIQALVALDRRDEARARAQRFMETYPNSLFGPAITEAVESAR